MKKLSRLLIAFALVLGLSFPFAIPSFAASASASIGLSAKSVYVGNQISVTVTYSCDTAIGGWNFSLNYDTAMLQYVSGADSTTSGTCRFANVNMDAGNAKTTVSQTVVFKALATGNTTVSTSTREIVGEDYSKAAVTEASRSISITTKPVYVPSTVNTLSSLAVEGFELTPVFSAGTTAYELTVEYPTSALNVQATPTSGAASVAVSGADSLAVGENTVTVTVTAENGSKQSYTIKVTRKESPYSAEKVLFDDGTELFFPVADIGLGVPEGFSAATAVYNGKDVLCFANATATIHIAALTRTEVTPENPEGATSVYLYLFDEMSATFSPYIEYTPGTLRYIVLPIPEAVTPPDGYYETMLTVNERQFSAYRNNMFDERYYLVYAAPISGEASFYVYDSLENTFQRYMTYDGAPTEEMVADLREQLSSGENKNAALTEERNALEKSKQLFLIVCCALGVLALALLIVLIVVIVRREKPDDTHAHRTPKRGKLQTPENFPPIESTLTKDDEDESFPPFDNEFPTTTEKEEKSRKRMKAARAHLPHDKD